MLDPHKKMWMGNLVGRAVSPKTKQQGGIGAEAEATITAEEIGTGVAVKDTAAPLRLALPFDAQTASGSHPSCLLAATPSAICATRR